MLKRIIACTVMVLMVFSLTACSTKQTDMSAEQVTSEATQEAGTEQVTTEGNTEAATEETAKNGGTAWPSDKMGSLPLPECQVVSISEYDASSMSGELIVVNYSGMSKEFAASYIVMLAELGFVDGVSLNSNGKIIFSGTAQDASAVNFDYDEATQGGNISYKPVPK